jgi:MBG domain
MRHLAPLTLGLRRFAFRSVAIATVLGGIIGTNRADQIVVTATTNSTTPALMGYNLADYWTNGNTVAWWRYSGVNAARIFISPSSLRIATVNGSYGGRACTNPIIPANGGVTNAASFAARVSALRTWQASNVVAAGGNVINSMTNGVPTNYTSGAVNYINWAYLTNSYGKNIGSGDSTAEQIYVNTASAQLQSLGITIDAETDCSTNNFPLTAVTNPLPSSAITNTTFWGQMWPIWNFYYQQAYYLAAMYNYSRFQMYNEPDNSYTANATNTDYLTRMELASDAIQCAIADVNSSFGKNLVPKLLGPVTTGGGNCWTANQGFGQYAATNQHINIFGQTNVNLYGVTNTDPAYSLTIQQYDFHCYSINANYFTTNLSTLRGDISNSPSISLQYPLSVSEFNVSINANLQTSTNNLDTPSQYSGFGGIITALIKGTTNELYCFKFGNSLDSAGNPAKNGMHYINNGTAPYNVGGITQSGEAYRLAVKGFVGGRPLLGCVGTGTVGSTLYLAASRDTNSGNSYIYSANTNPASPCTNVVSVNNWLTNGQLSAGSGFLIEEVSTTHSGGMVGMGTVTTNGILSMGGTTNLVQPPQSVWLYTILGTNQTSSNTVLPVSKDAYVVDGTNATVNYSSSNTLLVMNSSTNTALRSVTLLNFNLPSNLLSPTNQNATVLKAVLSVNASACNNGTNVDTNGLAYVYGAPNGTNAWSRSSVTWSNAPNLLQGLGVGTSIGNNVVTDLTQTNLGNGSAAMMLGQLVVTGTATNQYLLDVTAMVRAMTNTNATLILSRDFLHPQTIQDNGATNPADNVNTNALAILSAEAAAGLGQTNLAPQLILITAQAPVSPATLTISGTNQTYSGLAEGVTVGVSPSNALPLSVTYSNPAYSPTTNAPTNAGIYTVVASTLNTNYTGSATATLSIGAATPSITLLGSTNNPYNGLPYTLSSSVVPGGIPVTITYNGITNAPVAVGSYAVMASNGADTVNSNWVASSTNATLTIYDPTSDWRQAYYGTTNNSGPAASTALCGNGYNNNTAYAFGINPTSPVTSPLLSLSKGSNGAVTLSFTAQAAGTGPGYAGLSRYYSLLATTNLTNIASWSAVQGYSNITGTNQTVIFSTNTSSGTKWFYRLKAWLQ